MPWVDGEAISMIKAGVENYTLTIGGESATAHPSGQSGYRADLAAGGYITVDGCFDGSVLVGFWDAGSNVFAAYAHRR
jgi:hypothetical protein